MNGQQQEEEEARAGQDAWFEDDLPWQGVAVARFPRFSAEPSPVRACAPLLSASSPALPAEPAG